MPWMRRHTAGCGRTMHVTGPWSVLYPAPPPPAASLWHKTGVCGMSLSDLTKLVLRKEERMTLGSGSSKRSESSIGRQPPESTADFLAPLSTRLRTD